MNIRIDKSNWQLIKLGDVAFEYSKRVSNPSQSEFDRFVGSSNIGQWDFRVQSWEATDSVSSAMKLFKKDDYLLVRRSLYASDFRERAPRADFDGVCSGDILTIRENLDFIYDGFLIGILNSQNLWRYIVANASGSITRRIKWRDLAEYEFLLPPKDQQNQIAELLWAMDDVVDKDKEVQQKIEKLFLSFSKNVFTESKGEKKELKDISEVIMGQSPPGKTYNENGDGFAFLQGNAEFGDRYPQNIKYTTAPKKIAPKGSILISVRAPVGDLNIANQDYCIGRGLAAIVVEDIGFREYIYNFLKFSEYELNKYSGGSTFKAINKDKLSSLELVMPSNGKIENEVLGFRRLSETMNYSKNRIQQSNRLQKSLINEIFSV